MELDAARYAELFRSESREQISEINRLLLALEADGSDRARVEALFRAVHTLKGMAAAMGYAGAADVAHALEHLLDQLRAGRIAADEEVVESLFGGADALEREIARATEPAEAERPHIVTAGPVEPAARENAAFARIRQERLDSLVDQLGEVVVARDRMRRVAAARDDEELASAVDDLSRLIGELRDEVLRVRMVPVAEIFDRLPRLVRDAARTLGRKVVFDVAGGTVELDRSLVEEAAELLVHLLRNAVDHGIEPPEERLAAGKSETGALRVAAAREGNRVVIRVSDDGRGIQRARVADTAVRRGWLTGAAAAALDDDAVIEFITRPGFSTAERVTEVSGRGVGLDVVTTRLRDLGGSLEVDSRPGWGTTFALRLPLSLAIMRCLRLRVAGESVLVPLAAVAEVAEVDPAAVTLLNGVERLMVRDAPCRVVRLAELFGAHTAAHAPCTAVVAQLPGERVALIVDAVAGHQETVLKPYDPVAGALPYFSGAAVLPDGRPALVLDPARIANTVTEVPC